VSQLTIFYDGGCPLCVSELRHLARLDKGDAIVLEDIHSETFAQRFPHIDPQRADQILHGQWQNGAMIYGLDVTYHAWTLVGKRHWVAILRWPVVAPIATLVYRFFAKYRATISKLLTGRERCDVCAINREQAK